MSVHYKFNTALQFDTVSFDGLHITLKELKKQIAQQKKIGKEYDLQVTNAQTKETYKDENELISKNSSLIVARIPVTVQAKKQWDKDNALSSVKTDETSNVASLTKSIDISELDITEEDKIKTMMSQSTSDYDPSQYHKIRGHNQYGPVPPNYICFKCHQRGHWIKDCKATGEALLGDVKKTTGIPRSFMVPVEGPQVPGARLTPMGEFVAPQLDLQVYKEKKIEKPPFLAEKEKPVEETVIPEDLQCSICKDLMQDAVMAPCCGNSFCDECIRNVLVESEDAECPECNEKDVSPDTLIPNRFVRNNVNSFRNKTGYIKRAAVAKSQSPPRPTLPDFVPPTVVDKAPKSPKSETSTETKPAEPVSTVKATSPEPTQQNSENVDFLYDIAVEKERTPKKDYRKRNGDNADGDASPASSDDSYDPSKEREDRGQPIPPVSKETNRGANHRPFYPTRRGPPQPYVPGEERAGTPTVDERFDHFGRPPLGGMMPMMGNPAGMPMMGPFPGMAPVIMSGPDFIPPLYNPNFPPPMMPGGMPPQHFGGGFQGRGRPFPGPFELRPNYPDTGRFPAPKQHKEDHEDAFLAFQRMLREKEERDKYKRVRSSRSRSRSRSRPRSRSHSKSRSVTPKPVVRRRSYTPKRSRSRSHSPRRSRSRSMPRGSRTRSRSFVRSRTRSRSYEKSSHDRKDRRYLSPHRRSPPYKFDRSRDESGQNWDRRSRKGGQYSKDRNQLRVSPSRHYASNSRYESRGHSPDHYAESYVQGYSRHGDSRHRRRTRSPSLPRERDRTYYDEVDYRDRERRSVSRNRQRERERSSVDRYKYRDEKIERDRTSNRYVPSRSREEEHDYRKRERTVERERLRSRSISRRKTPSVARETKKKSISPQKQVRKRLPSPVKRIERSLSLTPPPGVDRNEIIRDSPKVQPRRQSPVGEKIPSPREPTPPGVASPVRVPDPKTESKLPHPEIANRLEEEPLARNPSPAVTEKSASKKEKKKDKERKKKKREKETEEEREERKKHKKERKERKKKLADLNTEKVQEPIIGTDSGAPDEKKEDSTQPEEVVVVDQSPKEKIEATSSGPVVIKGENEKVDQEQTEIELKPISPDEMKISSTDKDSVEVEEKEVVISNEETVEKPTSPVTSVQNNADNNKKHPSDEGIDDALDVDVSYDDLIEPEVLAPLPEPSKWELEDSGSTKTPVTPRAPASSTAHSTSVTNEVLKRAENAIFKKAISALIPDSVKRNTDKSRNTTERSKEKSHEAHERDRKSQQVEFAKKVNSKEGAKRAVDQKDDSDIPLKVPRRFKEIRIEIPKRLFNETPVESQKATSERDRILREVPSKGKSDKRKPGNSIQITFPVVTEKANPHESELKSPTNRISIKERLGGKVDGVATLNRSIRMEDVQNIPIPEPISKRTRELTPDQTYSEERDEERSSKPSKRALKKSPKRLRSTSESSKESIKRKKKRSKHKKEKHSKKKAKRNVSDSSYSSDSEADKKKSKKSKKKKKKR